MSEIEDILEDVEELIRRVRLDAAEMRLNQLLEEMGQAELRVWDKELKRSIAQFLPKRQRRLLAELVRRQEESQTPEPMQAAAHVAKSDVPQMATSFAAELSDLSEQHIFQWATYYRDAFRAYLDDSLAVLEGPGREEWVGETHQIVALHSFEIFDKGRRHSKAMAHSSEIADAKSLGGLARVTDLCLEWYSANANPSMPAQTAAALRVATSTMLTALAVGFASVPMGMRSGAALLEESPLWRSWTPFLVTDHLAKLLGEFSAEGSGLALETVAPLVTAIDRLVQTTSTFAPLPIIAEYKQPTAVLKVGLQAPVTSPGIQRLDVMLLMHRRGLGAAALRSQLDGRESLLITHLTPDARSEMERDEALADSVVPVLDGPSGRAEMANELAKRIESRLYTTLAPHASTSVLQYNFAREFPLNNPSLTKYYYVIRTSVRDMLSTFERRNGVRLWCSVRRSGKTTAGFDLGDVTGSSAYISQTCDSTGQTPNDSILYNRISQAIASREQLHPTFLRSTLDECVDGGSLRDHRAVLVLDEYETLFGNLRTSVASDERLRYTVAQPLLNQFVEFARDNLIVFLGQQPNAHNILMDQNQLSPYVEQMPFPLFRHGKGDHTEFMELIQKVFGDRVTFDATFAKRLHIETAGHPFLTVNMLVDFVDWLIAKKTEYRRLKFTADDVSAFGQVRFRRDRISVSPEYGFFRDLVIPQALSPHGRTHNPWLFAMYSIIRQIALDDPSFFTVSRTDFTMMIEEMGLGELGYSADYLLTTGTQSNFLAATDQVVAPAIRLLGRIAAVSHPAVVA